MLHDSINMNLGNQPPCLWGLQSGAWSCWGADGTNWEPDIRHKCFTTLWSGADTLPRWEPHGVNTEQNSWDLRVAPVTETLTSKEGARRQCSQMRGWSEGRSGASWCVKTQMSLTDEWLGKVIVSQESLVSFTGTLLSRRETKMNIPRARQAGTWGGSTKGEMPCKHDKTPHSLIIKEVWCLIYLCDNTKCEEVNSYTLRAVVNRKKPSDRCLTRYILVILPERFAYFHLVTPTSRVSF